MPITLNIIHTAKRTVNIGHILMLAF